jgi:hypothetical protein
MLGSGPKINSLRGDIMKKLLCAVMVLGVIMLCGVSSAPAEMTTEGAASIDSRSAPTPPAGHAVRYVLPYFKSVTSLGFPHTASMIRVYNHGNKDCVIGVQFRKGGESWDSCSITYTIGAQNSRSFCSRSVDEPTLTCSISCPDTGLIFHTGHAYVSAPGGCTNLAVDGQIVYTSDASDLVVSGTSSLRVVKYGSASKGD